MVKVASAPRMRIGPASGRKAKLLISPSRAAGDRRPRNESISNRKLDVACAAHSPADVRSTDARSAACGSPHPQSSWIVCARMDRETSASAAASDGSRTMLKGDYRLVYQHMLREGGKGIRGEVKRGTGSSPSSGI